VDSIFGEKIINTEEEDKTEGGKPVCEFVSIRRRVWMV
jgi:hypothetical protein